VAAQAVSNQQAFDKLILNLQQTITDETEEFRKDGMTAQLLMAQNQHLEALPYFERALITLRVVSKKKPNLWKDYYVRVLGAYAMALDFVGQLDAAENIYQECLQVNPAGFYLGEYAVFLHRRKRDFVQAQAYYERSLQLYPNQSSIHLKYAAFMRHVRRDLTVAEHHYKLAIETNTRNPDAIGSYASFLHGVVGDTPLAETYYREAVELDRTHANNLCNFGLFLSEEKKDYKLAEDLYQQVLVHTPRHANTLYNYAVMLDSHLEGRKQDAEEFYRRAIEVEPRHAFALYNLAVLLEDRVMLAETEDARAEDRLKELSKEEQMNLAAASAAMQEAAAVLQTDGAEAAGPAKPPKKGPSATAKKLKRREDVCILYQRAHESDIEDVTTAADYGRFLVTKMIVVHSELANMQDKSEAADLSLRNEQVVATADAVLSKALERDPENIVVLYNLALLYQKFKSNPNKNSEEHLQKLENVEKAEYLLKRLLTGTQGKHLAGMQQLGRLMVDKFKALKSNNNTSDIDSVAGNASGTYSEIIDTAMDCYENSMNMKLEKAKAENGVSTATVQTALLEYLKIVSSFSTNRQKIRTIAFIEGFMRRCQAQGGIATVLPHESDIRQMMKNMEVVINKGKEQKDKTRR